MNKVIIKHVNEYIGDTDQFCFYVTSFFQESIVNRVL